MSFELSTRHSYYNNGKFVKISYNGVTFEDELLGEVGLRDLAQEMLGASMELWPGILDEDKAEFHAEGIRQCEGWLRRNGYGELADRLTNEV